MKKKERGKKEKVKLHYKEQVRVQMASFCQNVASKLQKLSYTTEIVDSFGEGVEQDTIVVGKQDANDVAHQLHHEVNRLCLLLKLSQANTQFHICLQLKSDHVHWSVGTRTKK